MPERILSFTELRVYQAAFELQQSVFEASWTFPPEERYALTDQIRRSSRSIGANIAESWQKRLYVAHFVCKLTDADGEQAETQHWTATALRCGYIARETHDDWISRCRDIGSMLGKMIAKPDSFCSAP